MTDAIDIHAEFEVLVRRLFKLVENGLDKWKMTEKDWSSCIPGASADYKKGHADGIDSVKDMLPMLLDEDFWTR